MKCRRTSGGTTATEPSADAEHAAARLHLPQPALELRDALVHLSAARPSIHLVPPDLPRWRGGEPDLKRAALHPRALVGASSSTRGRTQITAPRADLQHQLVAVTRQR